MRNLVLAFALLAAGCGQGKSYIGLNIAADGPLLVDHVVLEVVANGQTSKPVTVYPPTSPQEIGPMGRGFTFALGVPGDHGGMVVINGLAFAPNNASPVSSARATTFISGGQALWVDLHFPPAASPDMAMPPAPSCTDRQRNGGESDVDCGGPQCPKCVAGRSCTTWTDCDADNCARGVCQGASCMDGQRNGKETDVDCGGDACGRCAEGKACGAATDCLSQVCAAGKCAVPTCTDKAKNGKETDTDCGGGACPKCVDGKACAAEADCASGLCITSQCASMSCKNDTKDGSETDVDCGGTCPRCAEGKACAVAMDCASGVCGADQKCAAPTCTDKVRNGAETDVDCGGGTCPACGDMKACKKASDCLSGVCPTDRCAVPTCADGVANGAESDVDCGGSCVACGDGHKCKAEADCKSGVCTAGACAAGSCTDGKKNGAETDADCGGGTCKACVDGKGCAGGRDCASGVCSTTGTCSAPTCTDGQRNGAETDVDCGGGACPKCADRKACSAPTDCASGVCAAGSCASGSCADGVLNTGETDVDCGGPCSRCADGKGCSVAGDCTSGVCAGGKCQVPTCSDAARNGVETDVDCGGGSCPKCADGKSCKQGPTDCTSLVCGSSGTCLAPTCTDGTKNGVETDVDCGGSCPKCDNGRTCAKPDDCKGGLCVGGKCGSPEACNGLDDDLDGKADEGCPTAVSLSNGTSQGPLWGNATGGNPFLDTCPAGEALIGIHAYVQDDGWFRNLMGVCGVLTLQTNKKVSPWTYSVTVAPDPQLLPGNKRTDGTEVDARCSTDQVVVAMRAGRSGLTTDDSHPKSVAIGCAPIVVEGTPGAYTAKKGVATWLDPILTDKGRTTSLGEHTCGDAVEGLWGRIGASVDAVQVPCGSFKLAVTQ